MRAKHLTLIVPLLFRFASAQMPQPVGTDCNPKLNPAEIILIRSIVDDNSFDFEGKNIGFASRTWGNKALGFSNSFLPITKKAFFKDLTGDNKSILTTRLLILDSTQKKETYGFDAILLLYEKKHSEKAQKMNTRRIITVFGYRELNYPDNLNAVGYDDKPELTEEDAKLFNRIFQHHRKNFDFSGKKIAFVKTNETDKAKARKTKQEYITRIKANLEDDFLFPYDSMHVLTDGEKAEYGNYDAVVIYQCKACSNTDALRILKNP